MTKNEGEKLFEELEKKIFNLYPDFKFGQSERTTIDGHITNQQYEFHINQESIRNTEYGTSAIGKYIHYTTLNSFCEILNSGELRLFNLNNLNDPFEFNHLIREFNLKLDEELIKYYKQRLFVSSFCRYNEGEGDDFNLWRLYGDNGYGIGIIFEVVNNVDDWDSVLLGNVIYSSDNILSQNIAKAISLANEYIGKGIDKIPKLLAQLLLYHKKSIWSIENESRLTVFYDHNGHGQERKLENEMFRGSLKTFVKPNGVISDCISLPLDEKINKEWKSDYSSEQFEMLVRRTLRIRIAKVIIGYGFNEKVFESIKKYSQHLYFKKWNSFIHYEKSRLLDY